MSELLDQIRSIVGGAGLIAGADVVARPTSWMGIGECSALAIVRPKTTKEISSVLGACHQAGQAVVPMGGLTGLVQATTCKPDEILLSLERMRSIESVDAAGATMTVEAGAALQSVQERAEEEGMSFPLDLGARGSAQIGGLISTNAGGNQVIRYGMMREQVLGLEAVMADGTIISSMNRMLKNNAGYDLKQLFIGAEGTLGVVTRAVLRLRSALASDNTALVAVEKYEHISKLLGMLGSRLGGTLNAFEVMWQDYYQTILGGNSSHQAPLADSYPYYIVIEAKGGDQQADTARFEKALENAFNEGLIVDAVLAGSKEQRDAIWAIRDDVMTMIVQLLPACGFDVSLPIADMQTYIDRVRGEIRDKWDGRAKLVVFGHLGDSNIHLAVGTGTENELDAHEVEDIVYSALVPFGGSVSAEHGIGLEKLPWLSKSRSPAELTLMKTMKQALDPKGILNPGKVLA